MSDEPFYPLKPTAAETPRADLEVVALTITDEEMALARVRTWERQKQPQTVRGNEGGVRGDGQNFWMERD